MMVRRLGLTTVAAVLVGAAVVGGTSSPRIPADAGPRPDLRLSQQTGYFHLPRVVKEYRRGIDSVARLTIRRTKLSRNLAGLRAMYQELQGRLVGAVNPDVKERVGRELITVARVIEDTDRELNKSLNDRASLIIADLYRDIRGAVTELARDHRLTAVIAYPGNPGTENPLEMEMMLKSPAALPLYIDPAADYTDELLARLNRSYEQQPGGE
ncbi:MAG: hypothetical protein JWO38_1394 [Gemmataceae bacterium]|nr:hypothetical protein [Gemmataceae bacterium]